MEAKHQFLQGAVQGLRTAITEGSRVVEGVHSAVLSTVGAVVPVPPPVPLITGFVYQAVRGVTATLSSGMELAMGLVQGMMPADQPAGGHLEPWQLHTLSAFNAAFGDHFDREQHPWALPMTLCHEGEPLQLTPEGLKERLPQASSSLVVFVHGLGMNDLLWRTQEGWSFGGQLQMDTGSTVLWLRYNSGRHIFQNGQDFAEVLEALVDNYPVPLSSLTLVGHSMGGLLSRSAGYYGQLLQHGWVERLRGVVCLGSPHRGAVLENVGNWLSYLLATNAYSAPLSVVGKRRSAGIKDLRHGSLRHEDWLERDLDDIRRFVPEPVPLVAGVSYLLVASRWGRTAANPLVEAIGDGLVTLKSALSPHTGEPEVAGQVVRNSLDGISHMRLRLDRSVYQALLQWYRELPATSGPNASAHPQGLLTAPTG